MVAALRYRLSCGACQRRGKRNSLPFGLGGIVVWRRSGEKAGRPLLSVVVVVLATPSSATTVCKSVQNHGTRHQCRSRRALLREEYMIEIDDAYLTFGFQSVSLSDA